MLEEILIGGAGGTIAGLTISVIQWLIKKLTERSKYVRKQRKTN